MNSGPALLIANLRQLALSRPQGCCVGLVAELRQIHIAARQLFHGVLGQSFIDPATLERMVWSLDRQIEAAQDLQPQLVDWGAGAETQAELADFLAYLEAVNRTVAARLAAMGPKPTIRRP